MHTNRDRRMPVRFLPNGARLTGFLPLTHLPTFQLGSTVFVPMPGRTIRALDNARPTDLTALDKAVHSAKLYAGGRVFNPRRITRKALGLSGRQERRIRKMLRRATRGRANG